MSSPSILVIAVQSPLSKSLLRKMSEKNLDVYLYSGSDLWGEIDGVEQIGSGEYLPKDLYAVISFGRLPNNFTHRPERVIQIFKHTDWSDTAVAGDTGYDSKTLYFGEILGADTGIANKLLYEANSQNAIVLPPTDAPLYVMSLEDALETILHETFTYWYPKRAVVAQRTSIWSFAKELQNTRPSISLSVGQTNFVAPLPSISLLQIPQRHFKSALSKLMQEEATVQYVQEPFPVEHMLAHPEVLPEVPPAPPLPVMKMSQQVLHKKKTLPEWHFPIIEVTLPSKAFAVSFVVFVLLFITPILLLGASLFASAGVYAFAKTGNTKLAIAAAHGGEDLASISRDWLKNYAKLPIVGGQFTSAASTAQMIAQANSLVYAGLDLVDDASALLGYVLGESPYKLEPLSRSLSARLDNYYQELSKLEASLDMSLFPVKREHRQLIQKARSLTLASRDMTIELPELLGVYSPKTYLILLQNNMELRPTGGFIGSFALVTFSNGRLIDNSVYDVYFADGQLQGYVRPPEPIVEYLGEASWHLRDANWDPDFPTSARRIEWFLDKTLDREVDGVIGVDLEVAETILAALGPVTLHDFDDTITADNVYEKLQYETDSGFFPGSRKKSTYLSGFAQALLFALVDRGQDNLLALSQGFLSNFESRDIQIALDNTQAMDAVSVLGWSGEVEDISCTNNCDSIYAGLVEANVGVNKANYYIKRKANFTISRAGDRYQNSITLYLTNQGAPEKTVETRYKSYIRLITNSDVVLDTVTIQNSSGSAKVLPEEEFVDGRLEAGGLVEALPGETTNVVFQWTAPAKSSLEQAGAVKYIYRKQAGVEAYPLTVEIHGIDPSLTRQGSLLYNTFTSRDISDEVIWK